MGKAHGNAGFTCAHCERQVKPLSNGSYRNHCPFCLYCLHVDIEPGDRRCACHGLMRPIGFKHSRKGLQVIHRCERCHSVRANRLALNDRQPDDFASVLDVMQQADQRR